MKRWIATLGALLLVPTLASAQGDLVSISELRAQVEQMGRWTQTYQVNGRTVDVDIPIVVPEVTTMPVFKCVPLEIPSTIKDQLKTYGMEEQEGILDFDIQNYEEEGTRFLGILSKDRFEIYHNSPTLLLSMKPSDFLKTKKAEIPITEIKKGLSYAEDNELTVSEAKEAFAHILEDIYGEKVDFELERVRTDSRARKTKGMDDSELGETVDYYPKGTYILECYQTFQGIPLLMAANQMYGRKETTVKWPSRINEFPYTVPHLWMQIMSLNEYAAGGSLKTVCGVLEKDVPLISVEHILKTIEKEIQKETIQKIYSIQLGYGSFLENETNGVYDLFPIWMVECRYAYQSEEQFQYDENHIDDYKNRMGYGRFAINAQTGKVFRYDLELENKDLICPEIKTWEDAQ